MSNYVQLKNILDNEVAIMMGAICFAIFFSVLIFAMGFCLGRIMRIKDLENKWDKELNRIKDIFNEFMEEAGMPQRIDDIRRGGDNKS